MEADADDRAYDALSKHTRLGVLSSLARSLMDSAAEARAMATPDRALELAKGLELERDDAATPFGNALDVLSRGPADDAERALSCALAAHAVAHKPPSGPDEESRLSEELLWLAAHTPLDATGLLDRALGAAASTLWDAIADRIRAVDQTLRPVAPSPVETPSEKPAALGRSEALVGAVALAMSSSSGAIYQAAKLAGEVRDPKLARVLASKTADSAPAQRSELTVPTAPPSAVTPFEGDLAPVPRGPVATALLAVTGLLLLAQGIRLVGRLALAYKRPTTVSLGDDGTVRVKSRTELLGRVLRDREVIVPRAALLRATRDVRYPSLAMYAGLLALAIGSYLGVATFVDGVRAASPSLLATGLAIVVLGLGLDFALTSFAPGVRGRCRVLLVSRDGARVCVGAVDPGRADAFLGRLASTSTQ
jgi:hypothetical protein